MLENKHNLTVDTQSKSIGNAFVEVVQNDNVALEVQIYNNNLLVDNTAYIYTLLSVLPSKEKIIRQGSIGPNGYPVFYLGVEEMSETGIILAMVQVYDELGNRVTSYDFKYRMKEDMSTNGVVPSADNPKFVIITEDSLSQTVQEAQLSRQELDAMKTDTDGVAHLTPNDRLVSDYNKINSELGKKANKTQGGWITPTLLNGWEHRLTSRLFQYRKNEFGEVEFRGAVKKGVIGEPLCLLPAGFYSEKTSITFGALNYLQGGAEINVTAGILYISKSTSNTWISFEGTRYYPN